MDREQLTQHRTAALHQAVARALTTFEHAVRRHAAAQAELRISRRPSTSKAALKTGEEIAGARLALIEQLERLGWQPPADVSLDEPTLALPRVGD